MNTNNVSGPENEAEVGIVEVSALTPSTPVRTNLKTAFAVIATIVTAALSLATGYNALASTNKSLEAKTSLLEKRLDAAATKADIRELRYQMRADLLSSVWVCSQNAVGAGMQCQLKPTGGSVLEYLP